VNTLENVRNLVTLHLSQIGDLLFSLPALAALRARWPGARVTAVMRPHLAELVHGSPWVDDTVWPEAVNLRGLLQLRRELRRRQPDLAVCFSQAPFMFLATRLCGAPVRAGLRGAFLEGVLTHGVGKVGPPSAAHNLRLVESLGCPVVHTTYEGLVQPPAQVRQSVQARLTEAELNDRRFLVVAPGASAKRQNKLWPRQRFLAVSRRFTEAGTPVMFLGTERFLQREDNMPDNCHDWSGTTSLLEAAVILEQGGMYLGLDSGLGHLAAAMGAATVVLYGPTRPEETGPMCGRRESVVAPDRHASNCMAQIEVEPVIAAVSRALEKVREA